MYFVYILKSLKYKKSYVGITNDVHRRLKDHNNGKSYFTSKYKPWEIIYTEKCEDTKKAREREKWFKSRSGRRFMKELFENI